MRKVNEMGKRRGGEKTRGKRDGREGDMAEMRGKRRVITCCEVTTNRIRQTRNNN